MTVLAEHAMQELREPALIALSFVVASVAAYAALDLGERLAAADRRVRLAWLAAFGLRVSPFFKEIDDADLWLPESKIALVTDIEQALDERQSVLLLGEPGVAGLFDTNGRWDLLAELRADNLSELAEILERVRLIKGIGATETSIHLQTYKLS